jgi:hypothetical protein
MILGQTRCSSEVVEGGGGGIGEQAGVVWSRLRKV